MPDSPQPIAASPGTLDATDLRDIKLIEDCLAWRDTAVERLFGRRRPRNPLRDGIIRRVVIRFGEGALESLAYYQRACTRLGSETAIRREVHLLEDFGLIILRAAQDRKRVIVVVPTQRLLDWYAWSLNDLRMILSERIRIEGFVLQDPNPH